MTWAASPWGEAPWAAAPGAGGGASGALSVTLGALTLAATGAISTGRTATLSQTLGALTAAATGALALKATLSQTLGSLTLSATATNDSPVVNVGAASYDDEKPKRKKRYVQLVGDKVAVFTDASKALAAAQEGDEPDQPAEIEKPEPEVIEEAEAELEPALGEYSVPIEDIRRQAAAFAQEAAVLEMFNRRKYANAVAMYELLRREQDEEEVEFLMMAL